MAPFFVQDERYSAIARLQDVGGRAASGTSSR